MGPNYICNTCNRRIEFSNTPGDNDNVCRIEVSKETPDGIVTAECGMKYKRIVKDAPIENKSDTRSNRSLAKKAGK